VWDLATTPRGKFPLLLHYHPLVIYRYQVLKQSDVVLAMFLLGNEFSEEQKRRNFEYYDPLTAGDSSLSACVESIIAAEIGNHREALEYFEYALLMDLANVAGNASDGVHIAAAAGVWSSLVFGFGGVRDFDGRLSCAPRLPRDWKELAFSLRFRGRALREYMSDYVHWSCLGALCEFLPRPENRVTLAGEKDQHGLPVARFSYSQCGNDRALAGAAQSVMEDILRAAGADEVITIQRYAHLVGGARMAADERHEVVDRDCRSFAVPNLYITDGSVLPAQGSANPALTIMAVAARAAGHLAAGDSR
jgi:hypothetical protein